MHDTRTFDCTAEGEAGWVQKVVDASMANVGFLESCTPGDYDNEGQPNGLLIRRNGSYAPGIIGFAKVLDEWRGEGAFAGIEFA